MLEKYFVLGAQSQLESIFFSESKHQKKGNRGGKWSNAIKIDYDIFDNQQIEFE